MDTDTNYRSISDINGYELNNELIDPTSEGIPLSSIDDTLKFSNASNIRARGLVVRGGRENAVDLNRRCRDVDISDSRLIGGGHCFVVIKGESANVSLRHITLEEPQGRADIELGGWSDQAFGKTTRVILQDVVRADGKPVRVVVGRADRPTVIGGNVKVLLLQSLVLKAFWWTKYIYFRLSKRA